MPDLKAFQTAITDAVTAALGAEVTVRFKGSPIKSYIKAGAFGPKTFFTRRLDVNADPSAQAKLLIDGYRANVETHVTSKEAAANG